MLMTATFDVVIIFEFDAVIIFDMFPSCCGKLSNTDIDTGIEKVSGNLNILHTEVFRVDVVVEMFSNMFTGTLVTASLN